MDEAALYIPCGEIELEGRLAEQPSQKAVVVTHPHPLYGGDMDNPVVVSVIRAYAGMGYTTLRFNFRGVGRSHGMHGGGEGEQEDVAAALQLLSEKGKTTIDLAGYSFGAWVIARGLPLYDAARRLIMVSPPVQFMDFSFLGRAPKLKLVVAGRRDDIGPSDRITGMLSRWNPESALRIIEGADHFFGGKTGELEAVIRSFLESDHETPDARAYVKASCSSRKR